MQRNKLALIGIFPFIAWLTGCVNTQPTLSQYALNTYTNPSQMQVVVDCSVMGDTSAELVFDKEYNERLCAAFAKEAQAFLLTEGPPAVSDVEVAEISLGASRPRAFEARSAFSGKHLERGSPTTYSLPFVNGKAVAYENTAYPRLGFRVQSILEKSPQFAQVAGHGCCMDNGSIDKLNTLWAETVGPNVDDDKLTLFVTVSGRYGLEQEAEVDADSPVFLSSTFRPDARSGSVNHTYWKLDGIVLLATALLVDANGEVLWSAVGGPPLYSGSARKAAAMSPTCIAGVARRTWEADLSKGNLGALSDLGGCSD